MAAARVFGPTATLAVSTVCLPPAATQDTLSKGALPATWTDVGVRMQPCGVMVGGWPHCPNWFQPHEYI